MWKPWMIGVLILCQVCLPGMVGAEEEETIQLHELSVSPMSEARPALKYRLQMRASELKNANAALLYHSAVEQCPEDGEDKIFDQISGWCDLPTDQLPSDEVMKILNRFTPCFRTLELAAQRCRCEWDMPLEEGFAMLMPSLGTYRNITRALSLKLRLEIKAGDMDQALSTLRTGLAMARGLGEGPTLIQDLVGMSITAMMLKSAEELMASPDSPNLYWALTELPTPFIDLRQSMSYEYDMLYWEVPELGDLDKKILSETQASALVNKVFGKFEAADLLDVDFNIVPLAWVMMHYVDGKAFLMERGMEASRIDGMPAAQVVMLYQFREFEEVKDNMFKWLTLPYVQYRDYSDQYDKAENGVVNRGFKANLFTMYLPALARCRFLEARLCRDIDMLRVIEALRLHAADNQGKFPKSLDDVTIVPVPKDPVTGEAFLYEYTNSRHVRLEAPKAKEQLKKRPVYELTLRP